MSSRRPRPEALAFGADYNPEQWPEAVWAEDMRLMREAGVNLVTVGVFAWSMLEPREGEFEFGWLDRILDMLHEEGIGVDLATPTAAPPPWFLRAHPQARPVTREGLALGGGSRQTYCPSSPEYADASTRITGQLARRYGRHPAVVLWHVNNEFGTPSEGCYCQGSAAAFREWLRRRHQDLHTLNERWGTTFWSQRYSAWEEVDAPRTSTSIVNESQRLDFARFTSEAMLECFLRERDILHELSPGVPVTTNFMAHKGKSADYWRWAREVDVVSNDHYLIAEQPDNHIDLAMSADLTRSLAGGAPWLLMEHSTGAVCWQPRNIAKRPGEMRRNSLAHLARGADGILYFQWRASRYGTEKFHSAMVPHGGTQTRTWREVVEVGHEVARLAPLRGSTVDAGVAVLFDWESWWALETDRRPTVELGYLERVAAFYEQLWRSRLTVDFAHPEADLSRYRMVVAPSLYLTTQAAAGNLREYVEKGGTLAVSCFSGIVDSNDAVHTGGHPGPLRELLGVAVEEWLPLRAGERVRLAADGKPAWSGWAGSWSEGVRLEGAQPVLRYEDGPAAGEPAATRNSVGQGEAWYLSTVPDAETLRWFLDRARVRAGVEDPAVDAEKVPDSLELVRRNGPVDSFLVAVNHADTAVAVPAPEGVEMLTGEAVRGRLKVPAGQVRVVRSPLRTPPA